MTSPNNNPLEDDERGAGLGTKLLAESKIGADNQIIILGLAVLAALAIGLGWKSWQGGSDDATGQAIAAVANDDNDDDTGLVDTTLPGPDLDGLAAVATSYGITAANTDGVALLTGMVDTEADKTQAGTDALAVSGITSVDNRLQLTPEEPAVDGDALNAAVAPFGITGRLDGDIAILEGVVPTEADSASAEAAAAAVSGVTSVDNRLTIVQPGVVAALTGAGVEGPEAIMDGTTVTVRGTVATAADATAAVDAAAAVDGVDTVIDELTILEDEAKAAEEAAAAAASTAAADLNALLEANPIQFATSSAVILDASFATLDEAATYLAELDSAFEVQGYTDVRGPDDANLALSQARADSVRQYLIDKGIAADRLTATGFGETTEFGEGDTAEALAANRRVRFEAK